MRLSRIPLILALLLLPLALLSTTWLYYLYPLLHGCAFANPTAPFRLLALGDPQLEGDSSLPDPNAPIFPSLEYVGHDMGYASTLRKKYAVIKDAGSGVVRDGTKWIKGKRKAVDLWGNDRYLKHIVRMTRWWSGPTHVAVLGDLLGSQWITDGEFEKRAGRYWGVVMRGMRNVPDGVFGRVEEEEEEEEKEREREVVDRVGVEESHKVEGEAEEVVVEESEEPIVTEAEEPVVRESEDRIREDDTAEIMEVGADKDEGGQDTQQADYEARSEESIMGESEKKIDSDDANAIEEVEAEKDESGQDTQQGNEEAISEESSIEEPGENIKEDNADVIEGIDGDKEEGDHTVRQANEEDKLEEPVVEESEDKINSVDADETEGVETDKEEGGHETQEANEEARPDEHKPLRTPSWGGTTEVLGADKDWADRVINIAGNHDVGYAGDLDVSRVARFEKAFGSVNWDIWFTLPSDPNTTESSDTPPALRIVVLNSMNIDAPAWNHDLQTETYSFMNHIITSSRPVEDKTHATVLLTHIPLEKQPGICVDSPFFNYFDEGQGVREQNMLSDHSSKTILQGVFGMSDNQFAAGQGLGRRGIVLNGHDHEGCDVMHFVRQDGAHDGCSVDTVKREEAYWPPPLPPPTPISPPEIPLMMETSAANPLTADKQTSPAPPPTEKPTPPEPQPTGWHAHRFPHRPYSITHDAILNTSSCTRIDASPHIREITLRSMMGDYSGHAGFLSAYFDRDKGERGEWVFEFASCGVGVQHWWWAVHIIDFSLMVMALLGGVCWGVEKVKDTKSKRKNGEGGTDTKMTNRHFQKM
jgi:hypothetical protein